MHRSARIIVRSHVTAAVVAAVLIVTGAPALAATTGGSLATRDPAGGELLATVPLGPNPQDVAVSPDSAFAYATTLDDGRVSSIDLSTFTVVASAAIGGSAGAVTVSPTGLVTVADAVNGRLVTLTPSALTVDHVVTTGSTEPISLSTSDSGDTVVFADPVAQSVGVVDDANQYFSWVAVGGKVWGVDIAPSGDTAYVANQSNGSVAVIGLGSASVAPSVTTQISVGGRPAYLVVSPDGSRVYVSNADAGTVDVIDTASASTIAHYPVGGKPWGIAASPDGLYIYVRDYDNGTLIALDAQSGEVISTTSTGVHPDYVAVSPDGRVVLVPNSGSGTLSVVRGYSDPAPAPEQSQEGSAASGDGAVDASGTSATANGTGLSVLGIVIAVLAVGVALLVIGALVVVGILLYRRSRASAELLAREVEPQIAERLAAQSALPGSSPDTADAARLAELRRKAADPSTTAGELAELARTAELRPLVAVHPNAYAALLDWLAGLGEPDTDAALRSRG